MNLSDYVVTPTADGRLLTAKVRTHLGKTHDASYWGLITERSFMPSIPGFVDFLRHLKFGKEVCDGEGKEVFPESILGEMFTLGSYAAEHLDARFLDIDGKIHVAYHRLHRGPRIEVVEPLDGVLMEDRRIDLDYWLKNPTPSGLPRSDTPPGDLYYYAPRTGAVAGFEAGSDGVRLDCFGDPQYSYPGLGVRAQKFLEGN